MVVESRVFLFPFFSCNVTRARRVLAWSVARVQGYVKGTRACRAGHETTGEPCTGADGTTGLARDHAWERPGGDQGNHGGCMHSETFLLKYCVIIARRHDLCEALYKPVFSQMNIPKKPFSRVTQQLDYFPTFKPDWMALGRHTNGKDEPCRTFF